MSLLRRARPDAEIRVGLHVNLPGSVEFVEIVDVVAAQICLQGREHLIERHAHGLALCAVNVDVELRRVGAKHREQPDEPGSLVSLLDDIVHFSLQLFQSVGASVFDQQFETAGVAQAVDRRCAEDRGLGILNLRIQLTA